MRDSPPETNPERRPVVLSIDRIGSVVVVVAAWAFAIFFFYWFFNAFKMIILGFLAAACLSSALRPLVRKLPGPRGVKGMLVGFAPPLLLAGHPPAQARRAR